MAVPRGAVLLLFLLLVAAELGTINAKMGLARIGIVKQTMLNDKLKEKEEKEKEKEEKGKGKEEGPCLSQSLQFKGFCFDSNKCNEACLKESFPGGKCRRNMATRKCFCKKPC